jgi:hypothetical protein
MYCTKRKTENAAGMESGQKRELERERESLLQYRSLATDVAPYAVRTTHPVTSNVCCSCKDLCQKGLPYSEEKKEKNPTG